MIDGLFQGGALPVLERVVQFTEARHKVLVNNIANLTTPYFKPTDLDPRQFQETLGKAIDDRRNSASNRGRPIRWHDTHEVSFNEDGLTVSPSPSNDNILFHDQNNRDVERIMQHLAENTMAHNTAIELIRNQMETLKTAIRERV